MTLIRSPVLVQGEVGNRLKQRAGGELTLYDFDVANRLLVERTLTTRTTYVYDADGNQRVVEQPGGGIVTQSWNYENKLIQVEQPAAVIHTYAYALVKRDDTEQRISKDDGVAAVRFVWDDDRVVAELDELGSPEAEYTQEPAAYGNLISQTRSAESSFYHYDALGSTRELTDSVEVISDNYIYKPFGSVASQSGTTTNPYQWVGEEGYYRDSETSLYSMGQRPLRPSTGRFLTGDPIRDQEENLYKYVGNNPTNTVDPSGLDYLDDLYGHGGWLRTHGWLPDRSDTNQSDYLDRLYGQGGWFRTQGWLPTRVEKDRITQSVGASVRQLARSTIGDQQLAGASATEAVAGTGAAATVIVVGVFYGGPVVLRVVVHGSRGVAAYAPEYVPRLYALANHPTFQRAALGFLVGFTIEKKATYEERFISGGLGAVLGAGTTPAPYRGPARVALNIQGRFSRFAQRFVLDAPAPLPLPSSYLQAFSSRAVTQFGTTAVIPHPGVVRPPLQPFASARSAGTMACAQRKWMAGAAAQRVVVRLNSVTLVEQRLTCPAPRSPSDILMPGGQQVGRPGASPGIRRQNGGLREAQRMFDELTACGTDVTPTGYPGRRVKLPNGGWVGLRPVSSSADRSPSLDVNIPGIPVRRIHFEP